MKKTFALEELDCANCAAKLERAVSKLEGVQGVTISFLTQKLTLEAADEAFDSVFEQVKKTFKKLEPAPPQRLQIRSGYDKADPLRIHRTSEQERTPPFRKRRSMGFGCFPHRCAQRPPPCFPTFSAKFCCRLRTYPLIHRVIHNLQIL